MTRAVVQRVRSASVSVKGKEISSIGRGLLILVGIAGGDTGSDVRKVADKIAGLRIFEDSEGKMNLSAADAGGKILAVSQFTLLADVRKGRRPSFIRAAPPDIGRELYGTFTGRLRELGYEVGEGEFGAHMRVTLENDGPVTIVLDSTEL